MAPWGMSTMRMGRTLYFLTFVGFLFASIAIAKEPAKPISLFNGRDLTGWTIFVRHADTSVDSRSDTKGVFTVSDGLIHVSGEEFGCLTTEKEFSNYRLRLDFKWGEKKWPPRDQPKTPRDSGILLHCTGPDKIWTKSIECQIQEHDCGDFWLVSGTSLEVNGKAAKERTVKTTDAEKPFGEWNTVEVVCEGDTITNIVNGVVVNKGTHASVTRGRILLQSEGAEVYYRNVELIPLGE